MTSNPAPIVTADLEVDQLTSTWKKFFPKFNSAIESLSKALNSGEAPTFGDLNTLARTLITEEENSSNNDFIGMAFQSLEDASEGDEVISENIRKGLIPLFLALLRSQSCSASISIKSERLRIKPLLDANNEKSIVIKRAKIIANDKWAADTNKEIRTSEMANRVWSQLVDEGFSQYLPQNVERVKVWIRSVAPEHARAKGRTKTRSA